MVAIDVDGRREREVCRFKKGRGPARNREPGSNGEGNGTIFKEAGVEGEPKRRKYWKPG